MLNADVIIVLLVLLFYDMLYGMLLLIIAI